MKLVISKHVKISGATPQSMEEIKQALTMPNPELEQRQRLGKYTGNIDHHLKFYQEEHDALIIPRGAADRAWVICRGNGEHIEFIDNRLELPPVPLRFQGKLKPFQARAVKAMLKSSHGTLEASTGSGKTVMALSIIAARRQPALIIVHTTELLHQWIKRIHTFLGIPPQQVGIIGGGKKSVKSVTIATIQSLCKCPEQYTPSFGHVIVDEAHKTPSKTFTDVVRSFQAKYLLGLTATAYRRDGLGPLIFHTLGSCRHKVHKEALLNRGDLCQAVVKWRYTDFNSWVDPSEFYSKVLSELTQDSARNRLICSDVAGDDSQGIKLVLSDRKEHCRELRRILSETHGIDAGLLLGGQSKKARADVQDGIQAGTIKTLIATGQLIGEGFDLPALETLFLATPVKFSGRLIQYIGRILRPSQGKQRATIYDYVDGQIGVFQASAKSRAWTYRQQHVEACNV